MGRVDVLGAGRPGWQISLFPSGVRRAGHLAVIASLVIGLVMSGFSCATASAAGIEHGEHSASSGRALGESVTSLWVPSSIASISSDRTVHRSHVRIGGGDRQDRADPTDLPSPDPTLVVGVDMVCAAVTGVRHAEAIVSFVALRIWFTYDVIPAGCVVRPDPPVPKIS